jgi:hypothetical protein
MFMRMTKVKKVFYGYGCSPVTKEADAGYGEEGASPYRSERANVMD